MKVKGRKKPRNGDTEKENSRKSQASTEAFPSAVHHPSAQSLRERGVQVLKGNGKGGGQNPKGRPPPHPVSTGQATRLRQT